MNDIFDRTEPQVMIDLLRGGSQDAFRYFYDKYFGTVYLFVRKHCESPKIAENSVQEVFQFVWINHTKIYHILMLKHLIARQCMKTILWALRKKGCEENPLVFESREQSLHDRVYYSPALEQRLCDVKEMAFEMATLPPKTIEQLNAELDFLGTYIAEAKPLVRGMKTLSPNDAFLGDLAAI